jgi:hypothetical protein
LLRRQHMREGLQALLCEARAVAAASACEYESAPSQGICDSSSGQIVDAAKALTKRLGGRRLVRRKRASALTEMLQEVAHGEGTLHALSADESVPSSTHHNDNNSDEYSVGSAPDVGFDGGERASDRLLFSSTSEECSYLCFQSVARALSTVLSIQTSEFPFTGKSSTPSDDLSLSIGKDIAQFDVSLHRPTAPLTVAFVNVILALAT